MAVSKTLALTALHSPVERGTVVELTTINGTKLAGKVVVSCFEENLVDIALVQLNNPFNFDNFVPWSNEPVRLAQDILVVGLRYETFGEQLAPYARKSSVDLIEKSFGSALFQASYYNFDGCSGAGVVTTKRNGTLSVIGVHVASHEDPRVADDDYTHEESSFGTKNTKKKKKVDKEFIEASINSAIHGHTSYSLVCEIGRVEDVVHFLRQHA